jgi:hypothetical protein
MHVELVWYSVYINKATFLYKDKQVKYVLAELVPKLYEEMIYFPF